MSFGFGLRLRPLFDVAIPGFYAWAVTVAVPIHQKDARGWPVFCSWLAAISLCATGAMVLTRLRQWSAIPVTLFVMASASVWFLLAPFQASLGFLGALGWAGFAIGWVRAAETSEIGGGEAARRIDLLPRHRMPNLAWVVLAIGLIGTLATLGLAWNSEGRERSLLAHAVSVVGSLSLMSAAAAFASTLGRQAVDLPFSKAQLGRTLALTGLVALGCWLTFLRT